MRTNGQVVFERASTYVGWDEDYYSAITNVYYDRQVAVMLRDLGVVAGDSVLDAGCGSGVHAVRVAGAGHRVQAIDISRVALTEAAGVVRAAGVAPVVSMQRADLAGFLPYASGSFRAVFSWGVIIHIAEVERALAELARVLATGGRLALYVTNGAALDPKFERLVRWILRRPCSPGEKHELGCRRWYALHGERLCVWSFDVRALIRALRTLGLVLVRRRAGELSEAQRRVRGPFRRVLQRVNNFYARAGFPAALATANLLIFEKAAM